MSSSSQVHKAVRPRCARSSLPFSAPSFITWGSNCTTDQPRGDGRTDGVMLFASCMHVAIVVAVVDLFLLFPRVCQDYPPAFPPRQPRREASWSHAILTMSHYVRAVSRPRGCVISGSRVLRIPLGAVHDLFSPRDPNGLPPPPPPAAAAAVARGHYTNGLAWPRP